MSASTTTILTNTEVIAVDQDPLGAQGKLVATPQTGPRSGGASQRDQRVRGRTAQRHHAELRSDRRRQSCGCSDVRPIGVSVPPRHEQDRVERLVDALLAEVAQDADISPFLTESWPAAPDLANHVDAIVRGEAGISASRVHEAWRQLLAHVRDAEATERALTLLERTAAPLYYGMLFIANAGTGNMLAATAQAGTLNFTAYSVSLADGSTNVILVDKDATTGVNASVDVGVAVTTATATYLRAPSLTSTTGVTFAGAGVTSAGAWSRQAPYSLASSGNVVSVVVPPASAVLVQAR